MRGVSFFTDEFNEFCIEKDTLIYLHGPRLRVGLGIVHGDFNFKVPEGGTAEFLSDHRFVAERAALNVKPHILIDEARGLDDESVAFPFSNRVAIPSGLNILC